MLMTYRQVTALLHKVVGPSKGLDELTKDKVIRTFPGNWIS